MLKRRCRNMLLVRVSIGLRMRSLNYSRPRNKLAYNRGQTKILRSKPSRNSWANIIIFAMKILFYVPVNRHTFGRDRWKCFYRVDMRMSPSRSSANPLTDVMQPSLTPLTVLSEDWRKAVRFRNRWNSCVRIWSQEKFNSPYIQRHAPITFSDL